MTHQPNTPASRTEQASPSVASGVESDAVYWHNPENGQVWSDVDVRFHCKNTMGWTRVVIPAAPGAAIAAREQEVDEATALKGGRWVSADDIEHMTGELLSLATGDPYTPTKMVDAFHTLRAALASRQEAPAASASPATEGTEYIDEMVFKLECFIDHATGGKLSKSSWALETLKSAHDEHLNASIDEALAERQDESATVAQPVELTDEMLLGTQVWFDRKDVKRVISAVLTHLRIPKGPLNIRLNAAQPCASQGCVLSDAQCREIYWELDKFGKEMDHYEYGLPLLQIDDREEQVFKIIRDAALSGLEHVGKEGAR